ncbi:hypothetical protein J2Y58_002496 [Sphingomonas sp. BE138]|nr:hypothetical protein [Sphingomonas sp. BE138]
MGVDDRDYMRARYRRRQGIDDGPTIWNDKRGRVEMGQGSSWTNARWQMAGVGRALLQAILVPAVALGGMYVIYRTYTSVMTSAFPEDDSSAIPGKRHGVHHTGNRP